MAPSWTVGKINEPGALFSLLKFKAMNLFSLALNHSKPASF